jgi:hypothetical protein
MTEALVTSAYLVICGPSLQCTVIPEPFIDMRTCETAAITMHAQHSLKGWRSGFVAPLTYCLPHTGVEKR